MKELTIEEKAKRYDEAIERAKRAHNSAKSDKENGVTDKITEYTIQLTETIFPELKESEDEQIRKELIDYLKERKSCESYGQYVLRYDRWINLLEKFPMYEEMYNIIRDGLEQQCEQNHDDKVEPKFKVGDWVVYNRNDHSREVIQIYDIRDNRYYFNDNIHFSWSVKECDEKSHLWTIQDTKDGDVLVASDDSVFIFAWVEGYGCIHHIALANDGVLKINPRLISAWESVRGVKPATKEQRDQLKKAMLKDGYKWDADKKELIKL